MRIAFTVHKFPPESLGGTEIYTWSVARALATQGHAVSVFYPLADVPATDKRTERAGVQLWRAPLPADRPRENPAAQYWHTFRDTAIEADFAAFLAEVQPELIHYQHVQGVSAQLIALGRGRPRVATLHDYWYFCANSQLIRPDRQVCSGPRFGWNCVDCATARADLAPLRAARPLVALPFAYRNAYLRRIAAQIDLFLAPSEFLRGQYIRQGFPADRIRVLENGVDRARLDATPDHTCRSRPRGPLRIPRLARLAEGRARPGRSLQPAPAYAALTICGSDQAFPSMRRSSRRWPCTLTFALQARSITGVGVALRRGRCAGRAVGVCKNSPLVIQEAYAAACRSLRAVWVRWPRRCRASPATCSSRATAGPGTRAEAVDRGAAATGALR